MAGIGRTERPPAPAPGSFIEWLRGWRYFFWFLAAVLLLVLFYAEENWRGSRAWAQTRRAMQARGESIRGADFIPPGIPDEDNFAMTPLIASGFGTLSLAGFKALRIPLMLASVYAPRCRESWLKDAPWTNTWAGPPADLAVWSAVLEKATNQTVLPKDRLVATNFTVQEAAEAVLSVLRDSEPAIAELRSASRRPGSRFAISYDQDDPASILLPHLAMLKQLSHLARLRADAQLALGRADAAFGDVELMLRLADATRTEPILVSQLVRIDQFLMALQPIANGMERWSEPELLALQDRLTQFDFCADNARTLRAERSFFGDGLIEYVRRSDDKLRVLTMFGGFGGNRQPSGLTAAGLLMLGVPEGWFDLEHLNYHRFFQDCVLPAIDATNRLVHPAIAMRAEALVTALSDHSGSALLLRHRLFSALLLPNDMRLAQKTAVAQTAADTAALACALERYRRRHGRFPDAPAALVPEFIARLPHDVINGQPLRYRLEDRRYRLYSVGWNQTDDGGQVVPGKSEAERFSLGDWVWTPGSR